MVEHCKKCGREQRLAWSITASLWKAVMDDNQGVVCFECFLKCADERGIEVGLKDFRFFGWTGDTIKGTIIIDEAKIRKVKILKGWAKEEAEIQNLSPEDLVIVKGEQIEKVEGDPVSFLLKRAVRQVDKEKQIN